MFAAWEDGSDELAQPDMEQPMIQGDFVRIAPDVTLGEGVAIFGFVNLYGCTIGAGTRIGAFVEIQKNVVVGSRCKISSHSFLCEGVTIEDECFIGHGVLFINDRHPRATRPDGSLQGAEDWKVIPTRVCRGASIGSGAVILCGVTIGESALIGAGAVVTADVPAHTTVAGVPARLLHRSGPEE
jgi:acetyltransferase-like isoleucine patch superfamily enzyme